LTILRNNTYSWGCGYDGQLGHGDTTSRKNPTLIKNLEGYKICAIAAGDTHTIAATNNKLFGWGNSENKQAGSNFSNYPKEISFDGSITQIACGRFHTILLDKKGAVYTFGGGYHGQLGHDSIDDNHIPLKVNISEPIKYIASGFMHSLAVAVSGRVYVWGSAIFGQLGLNDNYNQLTPVINKLILKQVKLIAGGYSHSLAVTLDNEILSWGKNNHGQLGITKIKEVIKPTLIENKINLETNENIIQIACGQSHSILVTSLGNVYSWGSNAFGELGLPNKSVIDKLFTPTKIKFPNGIKIVKVVCGANINIALSSTGSLFGWGNNSDSLITSSDVISVREPKLIPVTNQYFSDVALGWAHVIVI